MINNNHRTIHTSKTKYLSMLCIKDSKLFNYRNDQIIQTGDLYPVEIIINYVLMNDRKLYLIYDSFINDRCERIPCVVLIDRVIPDRIYEYVVEKIYNLSNMYRRIIIKTNIGYYSIDISHGYDTSAYKIDSISRDVDATSIFYLDKYLLYVDIDRFYCHRMYSLHLVDSDVIAIIFIDYDYHFIKIIYQNKKLQIISKTLRYYPMEPIRTDTTILTNNITFPIKNVYNTRRKIDFLKREYNIYTISDGQLYEIKIGNDDCVVINYNEDETYFVDMRSYNNEIYVVDSLSNISKIKFPTAYDINKKLVKEIIATDASFKITFSNVKSARY